MKRVLLWLWDRWYLIALVVGAVFAFVWLRGRSLSDLLAKLDLESKVLAAKGEARKAEVKVGAAQAKAEVEQKYKNELVRLSDEEKAEAERLKDDPAKLAEFLVRAGSTRD